MLSLRKTLNILYSECSRCTAPVRSAPDLGILYFQVFTHGEIRRHRSNEHAREDHNKEDLEEVGHVITKDIEPDKEVDRHLAEPERHRHEEHERDDGTR